MSKPVASGNLRRIPILFAATAQLAAGQVCINELMASNTRAFPDIVDFEDYPDWIELKNPGTTAASLADHYLSDDPANPYKWPFPADASIPAGGFLMVMADGHDAVPGQSFPRGYWPWRNFTTERFHTNFSLSSEGETLLLTRVTSSSTTPLVQSAVPDPAAAAVWKYLDNGSDQGSAWRMPDFNDSAWASGKSELGYGDSPATTVSFGASSSAKHPTTYFRHSFEVADPAAFQSLLFKLLVDDGAIVYLNGTEVVRRNMPASAVNHKTYASATVDSTEESTFFSYSVPAGLLVPGTNVIAAEVHQVSGSSSDISFDLSVTGNTLASVNVDQVSFPKQVTDVSYGRDPAGDTWKQFAESTPGADNTTAVVDDVRVGGRSVSASPAGGVHAGPVEVTLAAAAGEIRYTLNGAEPDSASLVYSGPLTLATTTVLRARCFDAGRPPGPILTRTYFIGETQGTLPYVSVVADPETLFGDTIGVYYNKHEPVVSSSTFSPLGYRDVYKGKDAPGHVEFFASAGAGAFRANCGIRMGGENNWVHPQRALNLAVRGKYGDDEIKYDLFPGQGNAIHTGITLRDGGDRWAAEMLRDCMWPKLAQGHLKVDTADFRPVVVFINGAYFGLHDLRERWDTTWFTQKYHIPPGQVDHLLYGHVTSGTTTLGVEEGDALEWTELMTFLNTADLTQSANWAYVESRIDMESFMDFVISESYGNNTSWFHNREFWKERKPGAKWRWFLTDMDRTLSASNTTGVLADMLATDDVLKRLKTNAAFKQRLAQRYAAHMAGTFSAARVQATMNRIADEISAAEVARHEARWWTGSASTSGMTASSRAAGINGTLTYATTRAGNVHAEISTQLGVPTAVDVTMNAADPAQGSLRVDGVPVSSTTFKLFPGIEVTVEAVPAPGFTFAGWTGAEGGARITITPVAGQTLVANFAPSNETLLGGTLDGDTTLAAAQSPYLLTSDLIVPAGTTLTIAAGVEISCLPGTHIRVLGALIVDGTATAPVRIHGRSGASWGAISFETPTVPSRLTHLVIRNATKGANPVTYPYAVSGLNADLTLQFVDIRESEGPVFCRGGTLLLEDSILQTPFTGDGMNVKQGRAITRRCTFLGNNQPDTDALDYDGVVDGLIEDCRIYRFQGSNSDGIDIGEACVNVLVQRNLIYYNSDKGISAGQGSTVTLRNNLVVGCNLGVGIKDSGTSVTIDRNTFADCATGVAVYEKNFGDGGGHATITHTIFSKCATPPVTVDGFSTATVAWSLSDTVALTGTSNLLADAGFVDPVLLNFQLRPDSPAVDSGDPAHPRDPDGTVADRGAAYLHAATHYPYTIGETVVIHEILANSGTGADWIELHNRTRSPVDISGWFLSDDATLLTKYRIPEGTILPPGGYVTFTEDLHFGASSIDPNKVVPFALSDLGETVHLSSGANNELTDYRSKEEFGPSAEGETLGAIYKPSTNSWNFVALRTATPSAANSGPRIGPVVISEVHYNPLGTSDSQEFIELLNVTDATVTLYDAARGKPWRITDGFDFEFPANPPLTLAAGERLVLARSASAYTIAFGDNGTRVLQWTAGSLDNGGETVQLARPGGVDALNVTQYIRVDRVNYDDDYPWTTSPDGSGTSLTKVADGEYGNDFANWTAAMPNPGATRPGESFTAWAGQAALPAGEDGTNADPDHDGLANLVEYALGTDPARHDAAPAFSLGSADGALVIEHAVRSDRPGAIVRIERSPSLAEGSWVPVDTSATAINGQLHLRRAEVRQNGAARGFFRMRVTPATP